MRPADIDMPIAPSIPRRRTDIAIATRMALPKAVAKPGQTAPLEIVAAMGPLAPVTALAYSADGHYLATGAYGRAVIWDLKAAKPARVLTNVLGAVNDVRFSPDSSLLAVAGGQPSARGDIRLFNLGDGKLIATLGGHGDVVGAVAFSPDGKSLASASFDKTVRLWNIATRESVWTFTGHSDFVHAVAFGPKGDWIVTASKDRTSRLIDAKTGVSRLTFSGTEQEVLAVGVKSDGSAVLTAGLDPSVSWWSTQTGERAKRTNGHGIGVSEITVSTTADLAASGGADKTVRLWNTKTMDAQRTIQVGSVVYAVALSANARVVASASFDGLVRLFDTQDGRPLATLIALTDREWLAVTPEGFAVAGEAIVKSARWRSGATAVNADWAWKAVAQPAAVAKALIGEKPGEPTFAGSQP
jgi:WD40 repeat protein